MNVSTNIPLDFQQQIYEMTNEDKISLVEFILHTMRSTVDKMRVQKNVVQTHILDDKAFGSIHLPADFDYDHELASAVKEKYGH